MAAEASTLGPLAPVAEVGAVPRKGRFAFRRGPVLIWFTSVGLILIVLSCFVWPLIYPLPGPDQVVTSGAVGAFTRGHLLGTDDVGRDLLSRSLYGGRVSIEVGIFSVAIGLLIGGALGVTAGYARGIVDTIIGRIFDTFLAFPALVLALAIAAYLGPSEHDEIIAISFFTLPGFGRYTRAATLKLRESEFLSAERVLGGKAPYIVWHHVIPNISGGLLTFSILNVAGAMLAEAGLSFLGAGVRPPQPSWGNMIAEGQQYISSTPHIFLVPSAFLFVTILLLNLLGDAVRRQLRI